MDLRSKLSKEMIKNAFFDLLKEKPLRKITVTDLCKSAGVNRTTFYKYYLDIYDLLEQIETEYLEALVEYVSSQKRFDESTIEYILKNIRKDADIYLTIASDHGDENYINKLLRKWYESNKELVGCQLRTIDASMRPWVFDYITRGDTAIVIDWIDSGMKEDERCVAKLIIELNNGVFRTISKVMD